MNNLDLNPGDVIDVRPLGPAMADSKHVSLLETDMLKIKRMVLPKGKELPEHKAPGEITVQCLEGHIAFTTAGTTFDLKPGQLVYLRTGSPHAVKAMEDSSFLLTIFLGNKTIV